MVIIAIMTNSSIGNYKRVQVKLVFGKKSSVNLPTSVRLGCYAVLTPCGALLKISTSLNALVSYYPP